MPRTKSFSDLDSRLITFENARIQGTKGRGKKAFSSWPHNRPSPASLAEAGFYYNPSPESNDNVTCFMCHRSLDGWEENDIPANEHFVHSGDCSWAYLMSRPWENLSEEELTDNDMNPHSDVSLNCRLETFNKWPHEKKKGWKPTSMAMAKAGFYYNPIKPGDDVTTCCYCSIDLNGWEPKDDPIIEHQRRSPDCLFFKISQQSGGSNDDKSSIFYSFANSSVIEAPIETKKSNKRDIRECDDEKEDICRKQSRTFDGYRTTSTSSVATIIAKADKSLEKVKENDNREEESMENEDSMEDSIEEIVENEITGVLNGKKETNMRTIQDQSTSKMKTNESNSNIEKTNRDSYNTTDFHGSDIEKNQLSMSSNNTTQDEFSHIPGAFPRQKRRGEERRREDKEKKRVEDKVMTKKQESNKATEEIRQSEKIRKSSEIRASFAEQPSSLSQFESFEEDGEGEQKRDSGSRGEEYKEDVEKEEDEKGIEYFGGEKIEDAIQGEIVEEDEIVIEEEVDDEEELQTEHEIAQGQDEEEKDVMGNDEMMNRSVNNNNSQFRDHENHSLEKNSEVTNSIQHEHSIREHGSSIREHISTTQDHTDDNDHTDDIPHSKQSVKIRKSSIENNGNEVRSSEEDKKLGLNESSRVNASSRVNESSTMNECPPVNESSTTDEGPLEDKRLALDACSPTNQQQPAHVFSPTKEPSTTHAEAISPDTSTNWKRFSSSTTTTATNESFFYEDMPTTPPQQPPQQQWDLADIDAVFAVVNDFLESNSISTLNHLDMDKSLLDWTRDLANKSEDILKQKCENIIQIIQQQGNRAFQLIEKMPVKP